MAGHRPERVANLLQEALTEMLQRGKLKDPRIGQATISEVVVTKDLKVAKVYVQCLAGAEEREETVEGLQSAESFIRRELRPALSLKQVPQLIFRGDETAERADRVLGLLSQIERERVQKDPTPSSAPKKKTPAKKKAPAAKKSGGASVRGGATGKKAAKAAVSARARADDGDDDDDESE